MDGTGRGSRQLAALAQVAAVLEEAGLDYWLFGGWAVDFYAGSITRPHADIDIAVWETDLPALARLLKAHGWTHAPSEEDDGGTGYERGGVRLELTYLASDGAGGVFTRLRQGRARWAPETFADDVRELLGVRTRVVALQPLREGKASPRQDREDGAKDRADSAVLARIDAAE